jgi:hypothetical protein
MLDDLTRSLRRPRLRDGLLTSSLVASLPAGAGVVAPSTSKGVETVPVFPSDIADPCSGGGALFYRAAQRGDATDTFVRASADGPSGAWSVQFTTTGPDDRLYYHTYGYGIAYDDPGVGLADITALGYDTCTDEGTLVPGLVLEVDLDGPGTSGIDEYTTVTFEPHHNHTVTPGEWQRWDVLSADAGVWLSEAAGKRSQPRPVTWDYLLERFPDATVKYGLGVGVEAGRSVLDSVCNVDNLTIGVDGETTRYDFDGRDTSTR